MILIDDMQFALHTKNTSYLFKVAHGGRLEHLYYGKRLKNTDRAPAPASNAQAVPQTSPSPKTTPLCAGTSVPAGNLISCDPAFPDFTPENTLLELSAYGKGDIREPFIELIHADGSRTCDFLFEQAQVLPDKPDFKTLPGSYGMPKDEHLCITMKETSAAAADTGIIDRSEEAGLILELHYYLYPECDVICRAAKLINRTRQPVRIRRLMSIMLDLPDAGYVMTTFTGAWAREMHRTDTKADAGLHAVSSVCGSSSNRANPFFLLSRPDAGEEYGETFGFHLIWSGNHLEEVQVNSFGQTRVITGANPAGFDWLLMPQEAFEAPEAAMTFSEAGCRGVGSSMHRFLSDHIIRGIWQHQKRPVLLNSWEAFYYDFNEQRLLELAKTGRDAGIELFVLDDGWFGTRNNDTSSLGDWQVNLEKLPDGLAGLSEKIHALGLRFGLWIEPEMVSPDSRLYRTHPDWVMEIPGHPHSEGRSQRILDLANPEVTEYLTETLISLLSSAEINYVKWDMNRIFSDAYSPYLERLSREMADDEAAASNPDPALLRLGTDRQGETAYRYMLGLYRLLKNLTNAFPQILFEGCAAGGGRFDPGMLCFFPQIWASDNTDPFCRAEIQKGYSYGYPPCCISAHVSASPNHQTGRGSTLEERFRSAAQGVLGYELNLCEMNEMELSEIRAQISDYTRTSALFPQIQENHDTDHR